MYYSKSSIIKQGKQLLKRFNSITINGNQSNTYVKASLIMNVYQFYKGEPQNKI